MSDDFDKNGGCAFPFTAQGIGGETTFYDKGMDLRDYFAGQALAGISSDDTATEHMSHKAISEWAYRQADAMLSARTPPTSDEVK